MKELFVQISDKEALQWLSAITPKPLYDFNKDRRLKGTCEWILKTEKYKSWIEGTGNRDLWLVGIPGKYLYPLINSKTDPINQGAGKSVLATNLIDELRGRGELSAIYFFFRDGDPRTMSPSEMVASVIAQLIRTEMDTERLMRILKMRVRSSSYFTNEMNEAREVDILGATLIEMLQGFPIPVVILLDALDECTDPTSVIRHLLEPVTNPSSIVDMLSMPSIGEELRVQFVLTGRPNVHDIFSTLPYISTIDMDVNEDIRKFINEKVADNESLRRHEGEIIATIYENSQGMFRYAGEYHYAHIYIHRRLILMLALVLEELSEPSHVPIKQRLKKMPKGISGMYELILTRLGSKGSDWENKMRRKLLLWVTLASRPIKVSEMQYACVTLEGDKSFDPDVVVLPTAKQMLACCGPLLEIFDKDRLRFTHRTVKEFLLQPLDKLSEPFRDDERVVSCMVNEAEGNAWMAMTCGRQFINA
jgi:hypothetical protein